VPRGTENFRGREETSVEVRTVRMNDEQSSDIVGMVLFVLFSLSQIVCVCVWVLVCCFYMNIKSRVTTWLEMSGF
jgi:hypothetical protein